MFNEISTNESPIPSPSKNFKEIQIKNQKNTIDNFSSFVSSFLKNQKIIFSQEKKEEKNSGSKPIKRILKKIIKKKVRHKPLMLDFDFILKEIFNNKSLVNNVYTVEKKPFPDFRKKILGKKRQKEKEKKYENFSSSQYNNKYNNNNVCINIKEKNYKKRILEPEFEELPDDFFKDDNIEVSNNI